MLKKKLWFLLPLVALVTFTLTACTSASSDTSKNSDVTAELINKNELTIGLEGTYAPFSYRKDGKLEGFEVELGKALAKKIGVKAKFVPTQWDSLIAGLGSQKFDLVLNDISETPARKKVYNFTTPHMYSRYALITRSDNTTIKSLADIKGKTFVEGTGTPNAALAKKYGAKITPSGDFTVSLSLVKEKRADGTINASAAWYAFAKNNSTAGLKSQTLKDSVVKPDEVAGMVSKKSPKLQAALSKGIQELRKDGTLKKLSQKYFGTDLTTK
ncbi:amino acid ABC transporter substrate-binding protein [Lactobacillus sp. HMSC17G08]|nr:amino acid ABC transporter substrate-binding protein [Lactobacillus sp. HMSC17G08]